MIKFDITDKSIVSYYSINLAPDFAEPKMHILGYTRKIITTDREILYILSWYHQYDTLMTEKEYLDYIEEMERKDIYKITELNC